MNHIDFLCQTGEYTLIGVDGDIPKDWDGKAVLVGNVRYETSLVYDLPRHIAVRGTVDNKNLTVQFV